MVFEPDFNQLRTALFGGQPERVPLFELSVARSVMEKFLGKRIHTVQDEIEFLTEAGYDYIRLAPTIDLNPEKKMPKEGLRMSVATDFINQRSWHASGQGIITSIEDFERFRWPKAEEVDYSIFERIQHYLPDGMKIIGQYGDIFTWTWDFMGFETFSYALVENQELVQLMFDKIGGIVFNLFENMVSFENVGALYYTDDIAINTGLFVSPTVYRHYLFHWMSQISRLCREKDIPLIYHTDGNIWEVFEDLKACGVDAIHPIEPQAMDIREVKQQYGDKFCLIGNVDVDLLARGKPEQIRQVVKDLIHDIAPGGGFCLGSGNTVPEYVPTENYRAMIETVHEFGVYPIVI